ncbi:MAG: extracellular solute-binding protein [Clostridia bacterium]|nr:extracellular solute-binding protein [Clostridia bacterium]
MKIKSIISLILCLIMAFSAVSCSNTVDPEETSSDETTEAPAATVAPDSSPAIEETESPYDENGFLKSSLPEELDFGGDKVTVLWWTDVENPEFFVEGENGEIINDAIFRRNANVESKLGITFEWVGIKGQYNNNVGADYANHVGNQYAAGDTTYDIISAHSCTIALTSMYGYCADLMQAKYLDFEKPWWPEVMIETATIGDEMYFVSGDISTNSIHQMYAVFYNKDLMKNYPNLTEPSQYVLDNNWNIENFQLLTKDLYQDLDGSNSANENDFYGLSTLWWHFDALYYGSGLRQAEKDPEELFKISDDYFGDKAIALNDSIGAWVMTGNVYVDNTKYHKVFCNGNALMSLARHHDIANYLTGDFKHGIAPVPKYNNDQENYVTLVGNPISFYSIYALSKDIDRAAAVLECWASEAYRLTSPAVFETTFKLRYSDTSVESQMYDIIRAGIVFDFGRLFNDTLGNMSGQWSWGASKGTSWATASKAYVKTLPKKLKDITDSFKAFD